MDATVSVQMTKKGLLIPRDALSDLGAEDLEAVRHERTIVIRPKLGRGDLRTSLH